MAKIRHCTMPTFKPALTICATSMMQRRCHTCSRSKSHLRAVFSDRPGLCAPHPAHGKRTTVDGTLGMHFIGVHS